MRWSPTAIRRRVDGDLRNAVGIGQTAWSQIGQEFFKPMRLEADQIEVETYGFERRRRCEAADYWRRVSMIQSANVQPGRPARVVLGSAPGAPI